MNQESEMSRNNRRLVIFYFIYRTMKKTVYFLFNNYDNSYSLIKNLADSLYKYRFDVKRIRELEIDNEKELIVQLSKSIRYYDNELNMEFDNEWYKNYTFAIIPKDFDKAELASYKDKQLTEIEKKTFIKRMKEFDVNKYMGRLEQDVKWADYNKEMLYQEQIKTVKKLLLKDK